MSVKFSALQSIQVPPSRAAQPNELLALFRDASASSAAGKEATVPADTVSKSGILKPLSIGDLVAQEPAFTDFVPPVTSDRGSAFNYSEITPQNPSILRNELKNTFSDEMFDALKKGHHWKKEVAVNINDSVANISIYLQNGRMFIMAPEDPSRVLRIDFDADGTPKKIASIYDREEYLPQIAARLGLDMGKQGSGQNASELAAWAQGLAAVRLHDERVALLNRNFQSHESPWAEYFGNPGILVNQNMFQASDLEEPLSTVGLDTCSALIVIDRASGKHYLAHIDAISKPESIAASLSQLNLGSAEIYLAPGSGDTKFSMRNAVSAIDSLGMADRIKLMKLEGLFPGVAVHQGRVLSFPSGKNLDGWNDDENTRF